MAHVRAPTCSAICRLVLTLTAVVLFVTEGVSADTYPLGVDPHSVTGISTAGDRGGCCWMYQQANFRVEAPAGTNTLMITVFIPAYAIVGQKAQSFSVSIDRASPQPRCCYGPGLAVLAFSIPSREQGRTLEVSVTPGYTFVPMSVGINGDRRHLSALLRSVAVVDATGALRSQIGQVTPAVRLRISVLFALVFIAMLVLTIRKPVLVPAVLILTDPFALPLAFAETTVTLPKVVLVAGLIGLAIARPQRAALGRAGTILLASVGLLVISMVISTFHAADHAAALRETFRALQYGATIVLSYCAYRAAPSERVVRGALIAVTVVVTLLALFQVLTGAPESATMFGRDVARISGPLEGPNQLAGFLGVALPMLLAWMMKERVNPALWLAVGLGAVALVLTFSRAGELALAIAAVAVVLLPRGRSYARTVGTAIAVLWGALFTVACAQFAGALRWDWLFGRAVNESGLGTRTELWDAAFAFWRSAPWIGIGPGNFELEVSHYYPGLATHANSVYFNTLAEQGIVGGIALGAVMLVLVRITSARLQEPLVLGALGAVVAMAFHQIADTILIYPKVGIIFWTMMGIAAAAVDRDSRDPSTP